VLSNFIDRHAEFSESQSDRSFPFGTKALVAEKFRKGQDKNAVIVFW
jgi:hypothetical protein